MLGSKRLRPTESTFEYRALENGMVVLCTFDDFGKEENPTHGRVHQHYRIHPDHPASGVFEGKWHFSFEREESRLTRSR